MAEMNCDSMTPIQAEGIPVALTGKSLVGAAQTCTGRVHGGLELPGGSRLH